jgi:D-psicose/D-tagatose/L-ribulose 3-epimerase
MPTGPFQLSVCNELYERRDFRETCQSIKRAGWDGIEIAPFTLMQNATQLPVEKRRQTRETIIDEGLEFVGLHWLTVGPPGIHVTTPDDAVRLRSWDYIRGLADLCADLRPVDQETGGVLVFGSPAQRRTTDGATRDEATKRFIDGVVSVIPQLEANGVTLLIEALPIDQCDVIQSLDEAAAIVDQLGSRNVQTMFDSHNAVDEFEPHAVLVARHWDKIRHIHVNELDGSHPRQEGGYDFKPVLQAAKDRNYSGWVSMEVFDFAPGAEHIVTESMAYLGDQIAQLD